MALAENNLTENVGEEKCFNEEAMSAKATVAKNIKASKISANGVISANGGVSGNGSSQWRNESGSENGEMASMAAANEKAGGVSAGENIRNGHPNSVINGVKAKT
jgi:phage gp45-like